MGMEIRQFTLDAVTWTPILTPINCNGFDINDQAFATDIKIRSTDSDSTTERTIPGGMSLPITSAVREKRYNTPPCANFASGSRVCYAQSGTGTITAVATFVGGEG